MKTIEQIREEAKQNIERRMQAQQAQTNQIDSSAVGRRTVNTSKVSEFKPIISAVDLDDGDQVTQQLNQLGATGPPRKEMQLDKMGNLDPQVL